MAKETLTLADFTEEKIAELTEKHGDLFTIVVEGKPMKFDPYAVPDEDDAELVGKTIYLRKPLDREMNFALSKMPSMLDAGKVIVKNCCLGGDAEVLADDKMLNSAAMQACELIEMHRGKLKKVLPTARK